MAPTPTGSDGPLVVGLGGSSGETSSSDRLLGVALERLAARGLRTRMFHGAELAAVPIYMPHGPASAAADDLIATVREADAVVVASPGYHGGMSGLLKNALDHLEELRADARPYLDARVVGLIVTAAGWQACGSTLASLRATVHALRGWPTPFGLTVNTVEQPIGAGDLDARVDGGLDVLVDQVGRFIDWQVAARERAARDGAAR